MANTSVIVKLQAMNDLSPELQKVRDDLTAMYEATNKAKDALNKLKADKSAIVAGKSGTISSEYPEIEKARIAYHKLVQEKVKGNALTKAKRELERQIKLEIDRQTSSLNELNLKFGVSNAKAKEKAEIFKKETKELEKQNQVLDKQNKQITRNNAIRNSSFNGLIRRLRQVQTLLVSGYIAYQSYQRSIGRGFELQRAIESQTSGIAALISANTKLVNSSSGMNKFAVAFKMSEQVILDLKKASVETAATFPELTAVFQQAIGGALGAGKAMGDTTKEVIANTITLSQRMTNIASSIGMPMVQVNEEIRSIIEGTTDINSRIAKMLNITNAEIKKAKESAGGLVDYLNKKLKDFDPLASIKTYDRMIARLKDTWDSILLDGSNNAFERAKIKLEEFGVFLKENSKQISEVLVYLQDKLLNFIEASAKYSLKTIAFLKEYGDEIKIVATALTHLFIAGKIKEWASIFIYNLKQSSAAALLFRKDIKLTTKAVGLFTASLKSIGKFAVGGLISWGLFTALEKLMDFFSRSTKSAEEFKNALDKVSLGLENMSKVSIDAKLTNSDFLDLRKEALDELNDARKDQQLLLDRNKNGNKKYRLPDGTITRDIYETPAMKELLAKEEEAINKIKEFDDVYNDLIAKKEKFANKSKELTAELEQQAKVTIDPDLEKAFQKQKDILESFNLDEKAKQAREIAKEYQEALAVFTKMPQTAETDRLINEAAEKFKTQINAIDAVKKTSGKSEIDYKKQLQTLELNLLSDTAKKRKELELRLQDDLKKIQENAILSIKDKNSLELRYKAKFNDELARLEAAALKDKEQKYLRYYELIGDKSKAWAIKEKQIISEMKGFRVKEIQTAIAIQKKQFFEVEKTAKKSFEEIKTTWDNVTSSMSQSFEDNFFDVLTGKFKDFKSFLKDFGKDMFKSFTNPYARDLSKSLAGGLSGLLGFSGGNLKEQMSKAGLNLVDGQWIQGKDAKESEIIVSSAGKIIKGESVIEAMPGGDKLMQSISSLSTAASALNFLKDPSSVFSSASNFFTNPIKGITGNIANTGASLYGAGFHGAGMALTGVGDGAMSFFTGTGGNLSYQIGGTAYQTGAVLGGALAGAAVGGIGGMLGDKLFGADTYASTTGAIGGLIGGGLSAMGAFGAASGPVGWIITGVATVLGGLFGKWKVKDAGLEALKDIDFSFGTKDIQEYIYKKKKSWFSSKSKSDYTELTKQKIAEIRNIFSLTDSMLEEINANVLVVKKGRYSGKDFFDVGVVKGTIQSIMQIPETIQTEARKINTKYLYLDAKFQDELGDLSQTFTQDIPNPRLDEIYNAWKDYAKSIDKTTYEALNESLNQMIQARRSFKAWTLKDDAVGLAQFQQTTALKDAEAIAKSLGISFAELTAENFLKKYDEAVKTSFDPDTLNKWNALSNAMVKHSEATTNYTNTLLATATQLANQKISIANALGVDSYNLQREMLLREAQALGEKTGYTSVDGNLKIVASKYNVSSEAFRDWTNRLDKKTEELGRDKKATYDYVAKLTQIVELDRARAKQNANTSNFIYTPINNTSYISHAKLFTDALDMLIKNTREASSNLKSVYDTSSNMLRKINSDNQEYIKEQYNKHLKTSKQLNTKLRANFDVKTSEEFAKSVNELSKYTDAYLKKENYNNELDYRFAKAVTSNNFKEFKDTSNRHESLKLIVEKLEKLRDEATTQTQINEATATGINELKDLFEGFLNGKYKVGA